MSDKYQNHTAREWKANYDEMLGVYDRCQSRIATLEAQVGGLRAALEAFCKDCGGNGVDEHGCGCVLYQYRKEA